MYTENRLEQSRTNCQARSLAAATHTRQSMMCLELADAEIDGTFMQFPLPPWLRSYYTTGLHGVPCRPGVMGPDLVHCLGGNIYSEEAVS